MPSKQIIRRSNPLDAPVESLSSRKKNRKKSNKITKNYKKGRLSAVIKNFVPHGDTVSIIFIFVFNQLLTFLNISSQFTVATRSGLAGLAVVDLVV